MKKSPSKSAFSIIEILVGMFIFSLGIISVYGIIASSVKINEYNKNYIIASNLAREQLELMRYNRDYNYDVIQKYDQINPHKPDFSNVFGDDTYYAVENDFSGDTFPITFTKIVDMDAEEDYRICQNETTYIYSYDCSEGQKKTFFYRYIHVEKIEDAKMKVTSKVMWKSKGIHDFEVSMILADWKKL
ncbi:MAG: hypothetical protein GY828_04125 [Candidatus Gracilibacteria bacterium]|nr:hypothetical protein [Candidatus Gracilibacteria bacterium]